MQQRAAQASSKPFDDGVVLGFDWAVQLVVDFAGAFVVPLDRLDFRAEFNHTC
ncbi:MAG: hypothetical protein M3R04_02660 [bacterium]|nr:hypothetical protein [bacterium]